MRFEYSFGKTYHGAGQGHGLAFSVQPGDFQAAQLINIFRELRDDLGCKVPNNGYLVPWAEQGVLLVNAVLTVRQGQANSHKGKGWEKFTDEIIRQVNNKDEHVVFVLWGGYAGKKETLIDSSKHTIINRCILRRFPPVWFLRQPSVFQNYAALREHKQTEINWQIPDL
jgi:uracil-DNA glycosylase